MRALIAQRLVLAALLAALALLLAACKGGAAEQGSAAEQTVMKFIIASEAGDEAGARSLLAQPNNVAAYFERYKGRDMLFLDYDYRGNDDVVTLSTALLSDDGKTAVVRLDAIYHALQDAKFSKSIVLHKAADGWKIYDYPGLYPVKVK